MGTIGGLKILEIRKQDFKLQNAKCSYKAHYETLQKVKKQHKKHNAKLITQRSVVRVYPPQPQYISLEL